MTARRSALGRGLGALIPGASADGGTPTTRGRDAVASESDSALRAPDDDKPPGAPAELRVDRIDPNPDQPRRVFDAEQLASLSESIRQHGVLQPVVVRRAGERYQLIVGERRWRATRDAGLATIPAVIADVEDRKRLELAIIENVQRHDLNPIELAHAYRALAESGATQEEIGLRVSKDRSSIANHLRLLELSRDLQEDVERGHISMGHAKALLQVANSERRRHLRNRVVSEGLSVRETEKLGREIAGPAPNRKSRGKNEGAKSAAPPDPHMAALVEALERELQTKVRIAGDGERGKIEIDYFGAEDLDRITRILMEGA